MPPTWFPAEKPGFYVLSASARKDFSHSNNKILSVNTLVSDLVLVTRQESGEAVEVQVLSGKGGQCVAGATVSLYQFDYQKGHRRVDSVKTDAGGFARIQRSEGYGFFLLARKGEELSIDESRMGFYKTARPRSSPPAWSTPTGASTAPARSSTLKWWPTRAGRSGSDSRCSPAGPSPWTFWIPTARRWRPPPSPRTPSAPPPASSRCLRGACWEPGGCAPLQRGRQPPRGGVQAAHLRGLVQGSRIAAPPEPPRVLKGEVKYYFGLPVVNGSVRWRVVRQPVYPWWWGWFGWGGAMPRPSPPAARASTRTGTSPWRSPPRWTSGEGHRDVTYNYAVTADVTDEGGETRTATRSVRLGFVSVEATVGMDAGFFLEGSPSALAVTRTDLNGTPRRARGAGPWSR